MLFLVVGLFSIAQKEPYPKVVIYESDTVLAFTLKQARQLSVFNEERKVHVSKVHVSKVTENGSAAS